MDNMPFLLEKVVEKGKDSGCPESLPREASEILVLLDCVFIDPSGADPFLNMTLGEQRVADPR